MKNYYAKISLILILTLIAVGESLAGDPPPPNDNFANATTLVMQDGTAGMVATNADSTHESGEPTHAETGGGCSVWFKFTPSVTKVVRINTINTNFDTVLAVYTGNSVSGLTLVGYNDDGTSILAYGGASNADLMLVAGTTYYIAVDGQLTPGSNPPQGIFTIALNQYDTPPQDNIASAYYMGKGYKGGIAGSNFTGTVEANEPIPFADPGANRRTVWYKWTSNDNFSVAFEMTENFNAQIGVYTSDIGNPTLNQLTKVVSNVDYAGYSNNRSKTIFFAENNRTYWIQIESHIGAQSLAGNFQLKYGPNPFKFSASLDQFGHRTSTLLFRPSDGGWYAISDLQYQIRFARAWGMNGDTPIAADFNGTGYAQFAAIRNENGQKIWYIGNGGALYKAIPWGLPTDKPIVGDWDSDGRADLGVIRNSANGYLWYIRQTYTESMRVFHWGTTGDKPVMGDFDGDRQTEVAVVRNTQTGLVWYILKSGAGVSNERYTEWVGIPFGTAGDLPVADDFDGDGKSDIAVFRPSNGVWYILRSSDGQVESKQFGMSGDKPQPGDYDGDGKADLAVYRASTGAWYYLRSGNNMQQGAFWGLPTDIPVSSLSTLSQ